MIAMNLGWIAEQLGWQLIGEDCTITAVSTDSRRIGDGDCFLALSGERFNAHDFIPDVVARGAAAVIVSERQAIDIPQLLVSDTRQALGELGALVRRQVAPRTVAITGSCGKTTVKEMCAAILALKGKVLYTAGNFNNDIGVPLTLLRLESDHEFAVMELGANHGGEIDYTTQLVKPEVAMVTNVGASHLEGFGTVDDVARAKGEIYGGLAPDGTAIYDLQSDYADYWKNLCQGRKLCGFAVNGDAPVRAVNVRLDADGCAHFDLHSPQGDIPVQLALPGEHNVANALAAAAACLALGASLAQVAVGLLAVRPVGGRLNMLQPADNFTLIDDTYNANVTSVTAAITLLAQRPGFRVLVLGDMGELGDDARHYHALIGQRADAAGIDLLITRGALSRHCGDDFGGEHHHFDDHEVLSHFLVDRLDALANDAPLTVLVKGSRSATMEQVVQLLAKSRLASFEFRSSFEC